MRWQCRPLLGVMAVVMVLSAAGKAQASNPVLDDCNEILTVQSRKGGHDRRRTQAEHAAVAYGIPIAIGTIAYFACAEACSCHRKADRGADPSNSVSIARHELYVAHQSALLRDLLETNMLILPKKPTRFRSLTPLANANLTDRRGYHAIEIADIAGAGLRLRPGGLDRHQPGHGPQLEASSRQTAPYVALHNINLGDPMSAVLSLQEWPKDKVPHDAISKLEARPGPVIGDYSRRNRSSSKLLARSGNWSTHSPRFQRATA